MGEYRMQRNTDVLVAGGGVGGTMAAIAAARRGVKVTLVERGGCLGGTWTAALVGMTLDGDDKEGLLREFLALVERERQQGTATVFEIQKYVLEKLCKESGVEVLFHSQICGVQTKGRRITEVKVITKSGMIGFYAQVVIDATGDGDVAAMAGCSFDYGRASDGKAQPMSMIALVSGLDAGAKKYISFPDQPFWDARNRLKGVLDSVGAPYSIGCPSIQPLYGDIYILSANQEYGKSGSNVDELTEATMNARSEIYRLVRTLRGKAPDVFGNLILVNTPECIGVREGRRIHGRYTITVDDMIAGRRHEDAVCLVRYWVDIHSLENDGGKGFTDDGIKMQPYDIPFRALLPEDIDNLVLAGRCISGDFYAHASYRMAGNMAPVGEAAGIMAAKSVTEGKQVCELEYRMDKTAI